MQGSLSIKNSTFASFDRKERNKSTDIRSKMLEFFLGHCGQQRPKPNSPSLGKGWPKAGVGVSAVAAIYHSVVNINNKSKNAPITMQMKKMKIPASRSIFASAGVLW